MPAAREHHTAGGHIHPSKPSFVPSQTPWRTQASAGPRSLRNYGMWVPFRRFLGGDRRHLRSTARNELWRQGEILAWTVFHALLRPRLPKAAQHDANMGRLPAPEYLDFGKHSLLMLASQLSLAGNSGDFPGLGSQRSPIVARPLTLKPQAHMIAGACPTLSMPHSAQRYSLVVGAAPSRSAEPAKHATHATDADMRLDSI